MTGLLLAALLAAVDQTIVGTAEPRIIASLSGFDRYPWVATLYLLTSTVSVPIFASLSDRYGRKPTLLAFAIGFVVIAYPAFLLIELGGFWPLLVVELVGVTFLAGYSANCAVVMAEQFPAEVRSTGIGLPYALAVAVFGGTAPYITTWMTVNGFGGFVWIYVAAAALVGVAVYALMPETKGRQLA
jgi:MHS family alpha-ketoglutarate permease-like MFS transporter